MKINIYWDDLSQIGQQTLIDSGFEPTLKQRDEEEPIGLLDTEEKEK